MFEINNVYDPGRDRKEYSAYSFLMGPSSRQKGAIGYDMEVYSHPDSVFGAYTLGTQVVKRKHEKVTVGNETIEIFTLAIYDRSHGPMAEKPSYLRYWSPQFGTLVLKGRDGTLQLQEKGNQPSPVAEKLVQHILNQEEMP